LKIYQDDIGEVKYVSHMGHDSTPAHSARVSFYNESVSSQLQMTERDAKLIRHLADHSHTSPFEHISATIKLTVPMFVRSQIMRHRTFSYNEVSRRYTSENLQFWQPHKLRQQAEKNLQCSVESSVEEEAHWLDCWQTHHENCAAFYHLMLASGVCREQARAVLPQSTYTHFWMSGNLNNWAKFLKLRLTEHCQPETRVVAEAVRDILMYHFPVSLGALLNEQAYQTTH
jgi:thymidylate synthase (FAD)